MQNAYVSVDEISCRVEADESFARVVLFLFEGTRLVAELPGAAVVDIGRHTQ